MINTSELLDRLKEAEAELTARLEAAEKRRDDLKVCLDVWFDKTEWVQQGVNEGTIFAKYLGLHRADVMANLLKEAEKERDTLRAENAALIDDMNLLRNNNTALRARIEQMEKQEPVAFALYRGRVFEAVYFSEDEAFHQRSRRQLRAYLYGPLEEYRVVPFYALPGAKGPGEDNDD